MEELRSDWNCGNRRIAGFTHSKRGTDCGHDDARRNKWRTGKTYARANNRL